MSLLDMLEPEEFVGAHWHRLTRGRSTLPHHRTSAVPFCEVSGALPVFFRGLGGEAAVRFASVVNTTSSHRLSRGLRLMLGEEKLALARRDESMLLLPAEIDAFASRPLNRKLYFWLTAFLIHMQPAAWRYDDPLARDLDFLRRAADATARTAAMAPGLQAIWSACACALRESRLRRPLKPQERAVEQAVLRLLHGEPDGGPFWPIIEGAAQISPPAARGYKTFLPVLAWGESTGNPASVGGVPAEQDEAEPAPSSSAENDARTRKASRSESDQTERKDYLALNRFEKMLSLIESMNINRAVEDDDEEGAQKALGDAEELRISAHSRKPSVRLKVNLDLEAASMESMGIEEAEYPEWDWRQKRLVPKRVRVVARMSELEASPPENPARASSIAQVRRKFEAFRPKSETLRARLDGVDLDMEAVVRGRVELMSTGNGSDRIYVETRRRARDISVAVLADISLSTDSWLGDRRVLDVEQEALVTLSHALSACGDEHALFAFTSRKRGDVRVSTLKEFTEPLSLLVERRIFGLRPGYYTRLGAAIRHVTKRLVDRPHEHRLLIVLTDGKPNDIDHYEGRFGIEDTRHAVQEARRAGVCVVALTIDTKAQDYFPTLFGHGGYAIVQDPSQLPHACLAIYRNLVLR